MTNLITDPFSSDIMMMRINNYRNLSENTQKYYRRSLEKIMRDIGGTSYVDIIENPGKIITYLKIKKIPYQMNLICIVIVLLDSFLLHQKQNGLIGEEVAVSEYGLKELRVRQSILKTKINETKCSIEKSVSQEDNWCSYEDLRKCMFLREKNAKKIIKRGIKTIKDILEIQKWVICGLYVGDKENPPLRLDFINMHLTTNNFYLESPQQNFLYLASLRTKKFVLGEYKTSSKYGVKQIPLKPYLNKMINTWISARNSMIEDDLNPESDIVGGYNLLFNRKQKPLTESTCCNYIKEAFEPTGKHITANLIRHIYITDKTQNLSAEERKRIAGLMCHNLEMQINYIKQ